MLNYAVILLATYNFSMPYFGYLTYNFSMLQYFLKPPLVIFDSPQCSSSHFIGRGGWLLHQSIFVVSSDHTWPHKYL